MGSLQSTYDFLYRAATLRTGEISYVYPQPNVTGLSISNLEINRISAPSPSEEHRYIIIEFEMCFHSSSIQDRDVLLRFLGSRMYHQELYLKFGDERIKFFINHFSVFVNRNDIGTLGNPHASVVIDENYYLDCFTYAEENDSKPSKPIIIPIRHRFEILVIENPKK
jgi:hypothetical protein